jgi:general secretion pathway protein A
MYESFYGFKENPFNLTPDPAYLYMSQTHANTYAHLEYAIMENKGFVVITGEIGSGKTTLINYLFRNIRKDIHLGIVNNTSVLPVHFLKMICQEFELAVDGMNRVGMLETFHQFLLSQFGQKKRIILIIDEAQNLPPKTIEAIRMLSNLESEKHHLLQMILIGQPELKSKLQRKDLKQFVQRVTVHCHLENLSEEEVEQYIHHRLWVAGSEHSGLFNKEAIKAVYEHSHGIPRIINILCDAALVYGFADEMKALDRRVIEDVVQTRKEGGILFSAAKDEKRGVPSRDRLKVKALVQLAKRLQSIERRTDLVEKTASNLEARLKDWSDHYGKQDKIIIELLKMLRDNLDGRKQVIAKYNQLRKQIEMDTVKRPHFFSVKR